MSKSCLKLSKRLIPQSRKKVKKLSKRQKELKSFLHSLTICDKVASVNKKQNYSKIMADFNFIRYILHIVELVENKKLKYN
jgi:hypothetical protein